MGGYEIPNLNRIQQALNVLFLNKNREIINNYKNIDYIDHSSLSSYKIIDMINECFKYNDINNKYILNNTLEFSNISRYFCFIPCSILIEELEIYVTHFIYYIRDDFININRLISKFANIPIGISLYINKNSKDTVYNIIKKYQYNIQFF